MCLISFCFIIVARISSAVLKNSGESKYLYMILDLKRKAFSITVIQVYAPTSNAEEAEVEQFHEDLQDLLELTPQVMSFSL